MMTHGIVAMVSCLVVTSFCTISISAADPNTDALVNDLQSQQVRRSERYKETIAEVGDRLLKGLDETPAKRIETREKRCLEMETDAARLVRELQEKRKGPEPGENATLWALKVLELDDKAHFANIECLHLRTEI